MRIVALPLLFLLMSSVFAAAQTTTTYTTTADGCAGKGAQYCTLPVTYDPATDTAQIIIDNRGTGGYLYLKAFTIQNQIVGTYAGFVANPDGTRNPFNGVASFESNDGTSTGSFMFSAYYVSSCSGRGCGGTIGWHYRVLVGSTVTQK